MSSDSIRKRLFEVRRLMLDLERHLDETADGGGLTELGRAWVRAAQIERALRAEVPREIMEMAKVDEHVSDLNDSPSTARDVNA